MIKGKHGHAKAHIVAVDIFTGKEVEDLYPCTHNIIVALTKREEYQVMTADPDKLHIIAIDIFTGRCSNVFALVRTTSWLLSWIATSTMC